VTRSGLVLLRFEPGATADSWVAVCASTHLTDFAAMVEQDLPTVNLIDPVSNAGLLLNVFSPENLFPVIVLSVMLSAFILAWGVSAIMEA